MDNQESPISLEGTSFILDLSFFKNTYMK